MTRSTRPRPFARLASRLALPLLIGLLAASFAAPATASADDLTISQAEQLMVDLLNARRTSAGLVPVRVDSRLMDIARARSKDMATKHYFSHTQPDGRNVFDILNANKIKWLGAGEIIAYNNYPTLQLSAYNADSQWWNSSGHKAIVLSSTLNYVGVGLAIDASNGKKMWTAVYIKGPDRTGARSTTKAPTVTAGATGGSKKVTVSWTGADVKLGAWTRIWSSTTRGSMALDLPAGHTYEFRTAARDNAGNWGSWSTVSTTLPMPLGAIGTGR
jgi:uncharacterized protein YkwD